MLTDVIETERLSLRPLQLSDVDAFVDLHADPRVNRFVGTYTRQQAWDRLAVIERQWAERGHGLCAVELRSSGELIGRSGLQYWEQFDEVELGWTFRAEHWGHGYATEAARACLDWGFATLEEDYFTALIRPGNEPSARVAERLGFSPRRQDTVKSNPVTVYALDRSTGPSDRHDPAE
ncbi:GNAT family N-acetyltransferase [Streptomyces sp. NBC_00846]|nr:GNAT family N-acetyltransferase [Streptomyces sp. NBC_00846]